MCILTTAAAGTAAAAGSAASAGAAAAAGTAATGTAAASTAAASGISAMQVASMAGTLLSGLYGAYSQYQSGKFNEKVAEENAKQQEAAAQDALVRGGAEANRHRQLAKRYIASQNTALAANGLDISSGSALTQTTDTAALGELDALTAYNNAQRDAYGLKVGAANSRTQGSIARAQGNNAALGTLLTTAANTFAGGYGMYKGYATAKATQKNSVWDYMMRKNSEKLSHPIDAFMRPWR